MQQHAAERGFAAPRLANDAHRLAASDREIDLAHRLDLGTAREPAGAAGKAARYILGPESRRPHGHEPSCHRTQREARPGPTSAKAGFAVRHDSAAKA